MLGTNVEGKIKQPTRPNWLTHAGWSAGSGTEVRLLQATLLSDH